MCLNVLHSTAVFLLVNKKVNGAELNYPLFSDYETEAVILSIHFYLYNK